MDTKYPDLSGAEIISFDIETFDPNLREKGPGVYRKDGFILGIAISDGNFKEYYSMYESKKGNQDVQKNMNYIKQILGTSVPKIGANIIYDIDWLQNGYGIKINGELNDIQIAEPLICEYAESYSLNSLAKKYLNEEKKTDLLAAFCKEHELKVKDPRGAIYLMPFELIREYAVQDAILPIKIFTKQKEILIMEDLMEVYNLEINLVPLLVQMRNTGVKINLDKVNEKIEFLNKEIIVESKELKDNYGIDNAKSSKQLSEIFDKLKIPYTRHEPTELMIEKGIIIGNPKLDKEALKFIDHPVVKKILRVRECRTILDTFFNNSYKDLNVNGRIHTMFNQLRSDEYGTISGRLSSSLPNLQNQPSKEDTMGTFCREIFIPEDNCIWGKADWSQIEYRLIVHYAIGNKSEEVRNKYNTNPDTDYHKMIMDWTGLERKEAKMLNFAMAYFMGVYSCSQKFGWDLQKSSNLISAYHEEVPFIKTTRNHVVKVGKRRGYIRTLLKRRARVSPKMKYLHKEHSLFNRLIQGSAADLMKKSMVEAYNAGLFNVLYPHITVHDELDFSIPLTKEGIEATKELKYIMENCIKLKIPILADFECGENWGNVSKENFKELLSGNKSLFIK